MAAIYRRRICHQSAGHIECRMLRLFPQR